VGAALVCIMVTELLAAIRCSSTACPCSPPMLMGFNVTRRAGTSGAGINCGVMMFRNSDWSRAFLAQLSDYAHLGEEALLQMRPVGKPGTRIHQQFPSTTRYERAVWLKKSSCIWNDDIS
jgi:hypothetical protein